MKDRTCVEGINLLELFTKEDKLCSLGSCFSDDLARILKSEGYDICINPFGVQYNPVSIANSIKFLSDHSFSFGHGDVILRDPYYGRKKQVSPENAPKQSGHRSIAPCGGGYTSFYHHGSFSRPTETEFLENANAMLSDARKHFAESSAIFVTFGTNIAYRHMERGIIVSNCHKHLARDFERVEFQIQEIEDLYTDILGKHPDKKWIFTVSPIRYVKDGLHTSQLSKSKLLVAIDNLVRKNGNAYYFPSYEIVLDELRDYAYYKEDLVHPNEMAVRYIFDKITHKI